MRRRDYGLFLFSGGLILLVIQFLVILFNALNGTSPLDDMVVVYSEEITILDIISSIWSSLVGIVLLIVIYIRRFIKGKEVVLLLVGALLWVIQLFELYDPAYNLNDFLLYYIIGIVGILMIVVAGFYDAYYIKRIESSDDSE